MADISSFEIESLKRDWIEGISGETLFDKVWVQRQRIERLSVDERGSGILIAETDPIEFTVLFFAALSLDVSIVLANPNWGAQEREELDGLLAREKPAPVTILIPTGGSTGGVKLAIHTWSSLVAASRGVQAFLGGAPVNSCCVLPLFHVSGLMQLVRSFVSGGQLRFDEEEVEGSCLSYVPTQLQRALQDPQRIQKLATAKAVFVGGGPLPQSVAAQARALKLPVVPVYGMTETAAMVAAVPNAAFLQYPHAGAVALGEAALYIEPSGVIRIQSPALFNGYHGHPPMDLTCGYLTDDEGRLDERGHLHVVGRVDRLINSGGEKIDPREVESALAKLAGVNSCLVVPQVDPEWGQRVVAYYTSASGAEMPALKELLRAVLTNYKIPKAFIHVERLPLDEKGKFIAARRG
jgi:O-succinylbenzoic acid--CoA ligase